MSVNNANESAPCKATGASFHGFAAVVVRTAHLNDSMFKLSELMKLHRVFQQRGALNEKQFVSHFRSILETDSWSPTQISQLFMKIDANSDGSIDWDEFTNFMFVHSQSAHDAAAQLASVAFVPTDEASDAMQATSPCQPRVRDVLVAFQPLPPGSCGHFVSSTLDGTIKTWSATWTQLSSFRALRDNKTNSVTAMTYLQSSGKVALASLYGGVQFFDLVSADKTPQSHVPTGSLSHATPLALCAMLDDDTGLDVLYVGDDVGGVTKIAFGPTWHMCDGDCPEHDTVTIQGTAITRNERHTDHVTRLAFVSDLNSVASSSRDGSVKVVDVHRGVLKRHFAFHRGAVYDFVWCPRPKFFASCGVEREILLWSPFSDGLLGRLRGHSCSIKSVVWNEEGQNLISLGLDDGTVRVWDVRQLKCLQVLRDPSHGSQRTKMIYFEVASKHLLTFSSTINSWPMHHAAVPSDTLQPHEAAVVKALFNPSFQQLVTMDVDGHIVLWNVLDGSVISHFFMSNTTITAAALDDTGRRLITGSNVGTQVTLWNFSNGSRLATLHKRRHTHTEPATDRPARPTWMHNAPLGAGAIPTMHTQPPLARKAAPKANEVTGVALITVSVAHSSGRGFTQIKYILSVGWDRRVYVWHDSSDQEYVIRMPEDLSVGHTDDILTMAFCAQKFIATGGMDGCVFLWGFNSGDVVAKFPLRSSIETLLYPRKLGLLVVVTSSASVTWLNPRFSLHHATVDLAPVLNADIRITKVDTDGVLLITALSSGVVAVFQTSDPLQEPSMRLRQLHRWKAYENEQDITAMEYIESSSVLDTFVVTSSQISIKLWTLGGVLIGSFGSTMWRLNDALLMSFKCPPRGVVSLNDCAVVDGAGTGHANAIDTYKREASGLATRGPPAVDDVWTRHDIHGVLIGVMTLTSISRNKGRLEGLDNFGNVVEVDFHALYDIHDDYATWARHDFFTTLVGRVWQEHNWAPPFKVARMHYDQHGVWHLVDTAGSLHTLPSEDACMNFRPFRSLALHRMITQSQPPFPHAVQPTGFQTLLESANTTKSSSTDPLRHAPSMMFSPSKFKDSPHHGRATRPLLFRDGRTSPTKLSAECRALRLPQVTPTKESSTSPASFCPAIAACSSPPRDATPRRRNSPLSPKIRKDQRKIHALQDAKAPPDMSLSRTWDFYLPEVDKL